jgi:hypothetical protein
MGRLPQEEEQLVQLHNVLADHFELMNDILKFTLSFTGNQKFQGSPEWEVTQRDLYTILGLYTKACKTFRAITLCCEHGLGQDAQALGRMLLETVIAATFILSNHSGRNTAMFLAHQLLQKVKQLNAFEATPELRDMIPREKKEQLEREVAKLNGELDEGTIGRIKTTSFCGEPLANYAGRMEGLRVPYNILYRLGSENLHCADLMQHLDFSPQGVPILKIIPGDDWVRQISISAATSMLVMLDAVNRAFAMGREGEIKEKQAQVEAFVPAEERR